MSVTAPRARARAIYIESLGRAEYDEIQLTLRLEGLGDVKIDTLRQWRSRDIKAGHVKPDELASKFEQISKSAARVVEKLNLPDTLTVEEKVECARLADLEDTHERMLRVVNAAAEKLARSIPSMNVETVVQATALAGVSATVADASIRLRQALINVREQTMKVIGAADGKPLEAEVLPPEKPAVAGLTGALAAFKRAG